MPPPLAKENQALLLTPAGPAAIAVIRLLGDGVAAFLGRHFSGKAQVGRCVHGDLVDGPRVIDDPVMVLLPGGGADLSVHGGPWVVQSVLELARREGFAIAATGEGIPLAGADGESLLEREVLAQTLLARTKQGLRMVLGQTEAWAVILKRWEEHGFGGGAEVASCEAASGYGAANPSRAGRGSLERVSLLRAEISRILADRCLVHLLHPPTVAIVGPANVGKSTLANQLFGQQRSITADVAGTTRDWVGEIANIDGLPVLLVDTPGIRGADDAIERAAIGQSRQKIATADLIVLVLDAARPLAPEQAALLDAFPAALRVVNRCDRPHAWDLASLPAIATVATTGQGVDRLRRGIVEFFGCADLESIRPLMWTDRQATILKCAMADPAKFAEFAAPIHHISAGSQARSSGSDGPMPSGNPSR